jgi:hypothetical protein
MAVDVDPRFWRDRAADMRTMAVGSDDIHLKAMFLQLAKDYDALADGHDLAAPEVEAP